MISATETVVGIENEIPDALEDFLSHLPENIKTWRTSTKINTHLIKNRLNSLQEGAADKVIIFKSSPRPGFWGEVTNEQKCKIFLRGIANSHSLHPYRTINGLLHLNSGGLNGLHENYMHIATQTRQKILASKEIRARLDSALIFLHNLQNGDYTNNNLLKNTRNDIINTITDCIALKVIGEEEKARICSNLIPLLFTYPPIGILDSDIMNNEEKCWLCIQIF